MNAPCRGGVQPRRPEPTQAPAPGCSTTAAALPATQPVPALPTPALVERRANGQPRPDRSRVLTAELRCYLCSEPCGMLEGSPAVGLHAVARFTPADGSAPRLVAWRRLRCRRCGSGSLFVDEPEVVTRREERVDWTLDRPKRGRPPRWLVALRARQDAA